MICVKICGLTTVEDARWAWRCGADLLGFILAPASPRYILPEAVGEIVRQLRMEGCTALYVGVFAGESPDRVMDIMDHCALDVAQLHGCKTPDEARRVSDAGYDVIVARRVAKKVPRDDLARYDAWAYLLDTDDGAREGGTGKSWRWALLRDLPTAERPERLIVAGGLTPDNVAESVAQAAPWGVDVSSGVESAPGRKDPSRVQAFIEKVRTIENRRGDT